MMARKMFMQQPRATLNKHPGLGRRLCICWKHINKRPLAILDKIDGKLIRSIVRDRSFIKSQRWEVQFSKRLDFGGSILKMHKM